MRSGSRSTTSREAGTVAGRLYASTVGSILGTFLSAIVTIPLIGTQRTMLGAAALLVFAGALLLGAPLAGRDRRRRCTPRRSGGTIKAADGLLFEAESTYQYVQVLERSGRLSGPQAERRRGRALALGPDSVLTGGEWDMFLLVPPLLERPVERDAVIGNAGGTIARAFGDLYPDVASTASRSTRW